MPQKIECNSLVHFTDFGYGRSAVCPNCGSRIVPETAYQKTYLCKALICRKCRQPAWPGNFCNCKK